ncbi:hypothetical protein SERLA73DRAFT_69705 [Serpula lacrymans var. lacrymans S7.3]|uniref:Uncharacterized protein n=1 Tax=Serpula lacrymans var. lacrymans (strain S7.3) TaxID=936435 RepID=F8PKS3_SERL3|nr:hypothetical protein SERLA73DRAFT_69705 [Serpula lacrymans var. lacrymans S7.3]
MAGHIGALNARHVYFRDNSGNSKGSLIDKHHSDPKFIHNLAGSDTDVFSTGNGNTGFDQGQGTSGGSGSNPGSSGRQGQSTSVSGSSGNSGGGNSQGAASGGNPQSSSGSTNTTSDTNPTKDCPFCISNSDPRVVYSGEWTLEEATTDFTSTTHVTSTSGSQVSLTFNATGITVFGTIPASNITTTPPTALYTIDTSQPVAITEPSANNAIANQPLFQMSQLSVYTTHNITINVLSAVSPFTLDYFVLVPSNKSEETSSRFPGTGNTIVLEDRRIIIILSSLLGSIVLMILIGLGFFLFRRRRQARLNRALNPDNTRQWSLRETLFTSTASILQNNPSLMSTLRTRSGGGSGIVDSPLPAVFEDQEHAPPKHSSVPSLMQYAPST